MCSSEPVPRPHFADAHQSNDQAGQSTVKKKTKKPWLSLLRLFVREGTKLNRRSKPRIRSEETTWQKQPRCEISEEVWRSAIYIGPGGSLMRDR